MATNSVAQQIYLHPKITHVSTTFSHLKLVTIDVNSYEDEDIEILELFSDCTFEGPFITVEVKGTGHYSTPIILPNNMHIYAIVFETDASSEIIYRGKMYTSTTVFTLDRTMKIKCGERSKDILSSLGIPDLCFENGFPEFITKDISTSLYSLTMKKMGELRLKVEDNDFSIAIGTANVAEVLTVNCDVPSYWAKTATEYVKNKLKSVTSLVVNGKLLPYAFSDTELYLDSLKVTGGVHPYALADLKGIIKVVDFGKLYSIVEVSVDESNVRTELVCEDMYIQDTSLLRTVGTVKRLHIINPKDEIDLNKLDIRELHLNMKNKQTDLIKIYHDGITTLNGRENHVVVYKPIYASVSSEEEIYEEFGHIDITTTKKENGVIVVKKAITQDILGWFIVRNDDIDTDTDEDTCSYSEDLEPCDVSHSYIYVAVFTAIFVKLLL